MPQSVFIGINHSNLSFPPSPIPLWHLAADSFYAMCASQNVPHRIAWSSETKATTRVFNAMVSSCLTHIPLTLIGSSTLKSGYTLRGHDSKIKGKVLPAHPLSEKAVGIWQKGISLSRQILGRYPLGKKFAHSISRGGKCQVFPSRNLCSQRHFVNSPALLDTGCTHYVTLITVETDCSIKSIVCCLLYTSRCV